MYFFFFKQKTAYEMRISDWSSDVCSSDLTPGGRVIEADSLSSSRSLGTPALSDAAFPAQDWWTTLGDPQLDALIREALQDSPSLAAADARVRQAQAQAGLANAARKDRKITRLNSSH